MCAITIRTYTRAGANGRDEGFTKLLFDDSANGPMGTDSGSAQPRPTGADRPGQDAGPTTKGAHRNRGVHASQTCDLLYAGGCPRMDNRCRPRSDNPPDSRVIVMRPSRVVTPEMERLNVRYNGLASEMRRQRAFALRAHRYNSLTPEQKEQVNLAGGPKVAYANAQNEIARLSNEMALVNQFFAPLDAAANPQKSRLSRTAR